MTFACPFFLNRRIFVGKSDADGRFFRFLLENGQIFVFHENQNFENQNFE